MEIINELKKYRILKDFSQEELAAKTGVSRQTIISIEKSVYQPTITLALKLSRVLGISVHDIFKLRK